MIAYKFGWKPQLPDVRDYKLQLPHGATQNLPAAFDLSTPSPGAPFDPSWDQGQLGSCGPNTLGENLVLDALLVGGATALAHALRATGTVKMPSRLFLYYNTRAEMGTVNDDSGVDNRTMLKSLAKYGFCDEELWPYNINAFKTRPPQSCYDQAQTRANLIVYQAVPQTLAEMKACLVVTKKPIIFGFTVYDNMLTQAVDKSGDIPMPSGRVAGGHDVLIVGYDDATQRFKLKNHWSVNWGKKGYGTVPYSYGTDANLAGDFWSVTSVGEQPAPVPVPTPPAPPDEVRAKIKADFDLAITRAKRQPAVKRTLQALWQEVEADFA